MAQGTDKGTDVSAWGETIDASQVKAPIVFHFMPNKYLKVADENLQEWEKYFEENVGFKPPQLSTAPGAPARPNPWAGSPGGSVSGSNGDWDDCDI